MKTKLHPILALFLWSLVSGFWSLASAQNIDTLPEITGAAVDKDADYLLLRDATAADPALRKMDIGEVVNVPGMFGTAAAADTGDFATAAQGALADTALQDTDIATGSITPATGNIDLNDVGAVDNAAVNAAIADDPETTRDTMPGADPLIGMVGARTRARFGSYPDASCNLRILSLGDSFALDVWEEGDGYPLGKIIGRGGGQKDNQFTMSGGAAQFPSTPGVYDWTRSPHGRYWKIPNGGELVMDDFRFMKNIVIFYTAELTDGTDAGTFEVQVDEGSGFAPVTAIGTSGTINTDNGSATPTAVAVEYTFPTIKSRKIKIVGNSSGKTVAVWGVCHTARDAYPQGFDVFEFSTTSVDWTTAGANVPEQFFSVMMNTLKPDIVSINCPDDFTKEGFYTYYKKIRKAQPATAVLTGADNDISITIQTELPVGLRFVGVTPGSGHSVAEVSPNVWTVSIDTSITCDALITLLQANISSSLLTFAATEGTGLGTYSLPSGSRYQVPLERTQPDWVLIGNHGLVDSPDLYNRSNRNKIRTEIALETNNCYINGPLVEGTFSALTGNGTLSDHLHTYAEQSVWLYMHRLYEVISLKRGSGGQKVADGYMRAARSFPWKTGGTVTLLPGTSTLEAVYDATATANQNAFGVDFTLDGAGNNYRYEWHGYNGQFYKKIAKDLKNGGVRVMTKGVSDIQVDADGVPTNAIAGFEIFGDSTNNRTASFHDLRASSTDSIFGTVEFYRSADAAASTDGTLFAKVTASGNFLTDGDYKTTAAGKGLVVRHAGSNARTGFVQLAAGTATVTNSTVTASTTISITKTKHGGTSGVSYVVELPTTAGGTFTAATTDLCTSVAHGLVTGDAVMVSSDDTLPAGLNAAQPYFVRRMSDDTFNFYHTAADANGNVNRVDITSTGTGTHSFVKVTNGSFTIKAIDASGTLVTTDTSGFSYLLVERQ